MTGLDKTKFYKPQAAKSNYKPKLFTETTMEKWDKHAKKSKQGCTGFKCGN